MQLQTPQGSLPMWDDGVEQRLIVSMLLASLFVAGALSLFRMPSVPAWSPMVELMVRIIQEAPQERSEPEALVSPEPAPTPTEEQTVVEESAPTMGRDVLEENRRGVDWDVVRDQAVQEYVDSQEDSYGYFNPELAQTRRSLSDRYQPRTRPLPKPIWENVEIDTLGRTVLRDGNCFKVLDDPNVGSREAFEMFGQFIAVCTWQPYIYKPLPFVDEIIPRYDYLRDPNGYVKGEPDE